MLLSIERWIEQYWYHAEPSVPWVLKLLSQVFLHLVRLRRLAYRLHLLSVYRAPVPVIVVGNVSVGGTGKTPAVIGLVADLKQAGYYPGIISRGYGGQSEHWPQSVNARSDVNQVGDEAVLLQRRCQCPMVVGSNRQAAIEQLLQDSTINVIVTDDGLQHYAMARDIEVVVIDGWRRFGNERCLPAGPLREPLSRLSTVDFCINNGGPVQGHEYLMQLVITRVRNLANPALQCDIHELSGQTVHAVAGIGHPERFFAQLREHGITVYAHPFADHQRFTTNMLEFSPQHTILMTEKDAVKCQSLIFENSWAPENIWWIEVETVIDAQLGQALLARLKENGS